MRRFWLTALAIVLIVPGWTATAAAEAKASSDVSASSSGNYYRMQNMKTKGCAVSPPAQRSLGDPTVLRHCDRVDKNQWHVRILFRTRAGYPVVQFRNQHSGHCLGVSRNTAGAVVRNQYCVHPTGGRPNSTKWRVRGLNNWGVMHVRNQWSGKCLGFKKPLEPIGRRLAQGHCDSTLRRQQWVGFVTAFG